MNQQEKDEDQAEKDRLKKELTDKYAEEFKSRLEQVEKQLTREARYRLYWVIFAAFATVAGLLAIGLYAATKEVNDQIAKANDQLETTGARLDDARLEYKSLAAMAEAASKSLNDARAGYKSLAAKAQATEDRLDQARDEYVSFATKADAELQALDQTLEAAKTRLDSIVLTQATVRNTKQELEQVTSELEQGDQAVRTARDQLKTAAKKYLDIRDGYEDVATKSRRATRQVLLDLKKVENRMNRIEDTESTMQAASAQLKRMTSELEQGNQEVAIARDQLKTAAKDLRRTSAEYNAAIAKAKAVLEARRQKNRGKGETRMPE